MHDIGFLPEPNILKFIIGATYTNDSISVQGHKFCTSQKLSASVFMRRTDVKEDMSSNCSKDETLDFLNVLMQ